MAIVARAAGPNFVLAHGPRISSRAVQFSFSWSWTSERADDRITKFTWVHDLQPHLTVSPATTTGVGRRENTSVYRDLDQVRESVALLDLYP